MRRKAVRSILTPLLLALVACGGGSDEPASPVDGSDATPREGRIASFDGVEIAYAARGSGDVALVFIHGWLCDRGFWSEQMTAFDDNLTVVAVDLPGHGESGHAGEPRTIDALGRDVFAVVEALDLPSVIFVGHSMGAPVALAAAARLPQRTLGVIAVDALHDLAWKPAKEQWQPLIAAFEGDFAATCSGMVREMFPAATEPDLVSATTRSMCDGDPQVGVALMREMAVLDSAALAARAATRVRCINSAAFRPTAVEANRAIVPDFDAVILDGVGHFPMLEAPQRFDAELRRFIEELTSTPTV